ncbi:MAG: helix-turn-helix transcriptional regulator [Lachnospiraceae bacterium]|nr:helix-turn-helix transcriptional regulator [Lachnospiraceae bacterium]
MNELHLSEHIAGLRRERKITQEELADFLGVTKAAVSKWETGQTMPDILLLPQLAGFFGVTIDVLMGYEAQLSREQIRRCYQELCSDFAKLPFSETMEKTRALVRRYYACYPFLLQICVLYLNHFMLAEKEEGRKILEEGLLLCDRISQGCKDVGICEDAVALKAVLELQLGHADEVIEILEPMLDLSRISWKSGSVLLQAYCMAEKRELARSYAQVEQYTDLLSLIGGAVELLSLYEEEPERCEETVRRIQGVLELYQVEKLHPNQAAQFYYQSALVYAGHGKKEKALEMLDGFGRCVGRLLRMDQLKLCGDGYFDRLEEWMERLPLGNMAPRDKTFIRESALGALSHPVFSELKETREFQSLQSELLKGGVTHA